MELQDSMKDYIKLHKEKNNREPNKYEEEIYRALLYHIHWEAPYTMEQNRRDIQNISNLIDNI